MLAHTSWPWRGRRRAASLAAALLIAAMTSTLGCGLLTSTVDTLPTYSGPRGFLDEAVTYEKDEEHFWYGSLGGERGHKKQIGFGVPYWLWVALPEMFPEHLPDKTPGRGYRAFGFVYEPGRDPRFDLPIGMSRRRYLTIDRVWLNCAVCHTGTVRETPDSPPTIVSGMPANRYNQGAWVKFLFAVADDPRFNGQQVMQTIRTLQEGRPHRPDDGTLAPRSRPAALGPVDAAVFEKLVVPIMRRRLLDLKHQAGFLAFATWGPGRVDTFNPPKAFLNFPMDRARPEEKIGVTDLPSVWNQAAREGMRLHWDGNNDSLHERNLSAALASSIPTTLDKCSLRRVARYLGTLKPRVEFPKSKRHADPARLELGKTVYAQYCLNCHGTPDPPFRTAETGQRVGTVVPLSEVGTDRHRLDSYTEELASAQNSLYAEFPLPDSEPCSADDPESKNYPSRFTRFRKTQGYASMPLDGLWLRAPYLHNGSVPDLRALLTSWRDRPKVFWTGYDVYDYERVGFVTSGPGAEREGWRYDTEVDGNGNQGHEYGAGLPDDRKNALIEYLKTF